jgi:large subunit ribosomal protein L22
MKEVKAVLKYFRMSPRKVRLVAKVIKGLDVERAEKELLFRNKKAAKAILKLLKSAVANALNQGLTKEKLYVKNITVNKGPAYKRYYFKALGRVGLIRKQTSHIEIILASKNGS